MKVFLGRDRQGCGYYRGILPMTELANRGRATWFDSAMPAEVFAGEADVVVAQRTCLPSPSAVFQAMCREGVFARLVRQPCSEPTDLVVAASLARRERALLGEVGLPVGQDAGGPVHRRG
ncbi:hypothetical protein [Amycolatopsis sp. 195334CR]|uniref:hypothetical protein n=1 Tax=Amycolatopsis sp. 195334CR TaxID=2814588 RepID=UPI001A8EEA80|nr:hypothetical protein [Amycolatopsis sp. 195334CR]MBN6034078.1 hypothetical protein [Amycolatopsis sp. 195334CR]